MKHAHDLFIRLCFWIGVRVMALGVYSWHHRIYTWDNSVTYVWALLHEGQNHFAAQQLNAAKSESKMTSDLPA